MKTDKQRSFWIIVGVSLPALLILYLLNAYALIPVFIAIVFVHGLIPCLIGMLTGLFVKKSFVSAGALAAIGLLLLLVVASPPLKLSYGDHNYYTD